MSKGVSLVISSVLGIAILLAILGVVAFGVSSYYSTVSQSAQQSEADALSSSISSQITTLYTSNQDSSTSPPSGQNVTIAQTVVNIPPKLGGRDYEMSLTPRGEYWTTIDVESFGDDVEEVSTDREYASVRIETFGRDPITTIRPINNLPIRVEGEVRGGTTAVISYVRVNDGSSTRDYITLS